MKKCILISIISLFGLSGCATYGGMSGTLPIGSSSSIASNIQLNSSGKVYANTSMGGYLK